jgi:hypothetical protein
VIWMRESAWPSLVSCSVISGVFKSISDTFLSKSFLSSLVASSSLNSS